MLPHIMHQMCMLVKSSKYWLPLLISLLAGGLMCMHESFIVCAPTLNFLPSASLCGERAATGFALAMQT